MTRAAGWSRISAPRGTAKSRNVAQSACAEIEIYGPCNLSDFGGSPLTLSCQSSPGVPSSLSVQRLAKMTSSGRDGEFEGFSGASTSLVDLYTAVSRLGLISAAMKGLDEAFSVECWVDLMVVKITYPRAVASERNVALIQDGPGRPASKHAKCIIWKPLSTPRPHAKEHEHKKKRLSRTRVDSFLVGKRLIGIKHYRFRSWQALG